MVYEDEIPVKLEIDKTYSTKEIINYISYNNGIVISVDTPVFYSYDTRKYRVVGYYEGYIHYGKERRTYVTPSNKEIIYIVEVDIA